MALGRIKVHGHWTIEVRDPDGALKTHREFENALVANSGPGAMVAILACFTAGNCPNMTNVLVWDVQLDGSPQPCTTQAFIDPLNPLAGTTTVPAPCLLQGPAQNYPLSAKPQGTTFVLSGAIAAGQNGTVATVTTSLGIAGGPFPGGPFTAKTLPTPISVLAGQLIQVTVVYSFS